MCFLIRKIITQTTQLVETIFGELEEIQKGEGKIDSEKMIERLKLIHSYVLPLHGISLNLGNAYQVCLFVMCEMRK